jgi:(S)-mandelate dehydrogenase
MGASGVLVGRATLFGAVAQAEPGALRALEILSEELRRTLQLCGVTQLSQFNKDLLRTT